MVQSSQQADTKCEALSITSTGGKYWIQAKVKLSKHRRFNAKKSSAVAINQSHGMTSRNKNGLPYSWHQI